jgi:glycosyltransferase involved in cell wall biosynthesis
MDALYQHNQRFWSTDMYTYIRRKTYPFDISFLIPTIPGRDASLQRMMQSIHERMGRIAPNLRYEIRLGFDNKEASVGRKRDNLLQASKGKYSAFVDDDDEITDAYIEDLAETIKGNYHVMRLRGTVQQYTFTHSIAVKLNEPMARGNDFFRPPNHLNPMLTDVAKLVRFKDASRGEDLDWTMRMANVGFLTSEYTSDLSRIHYIYNMRETIKPENVAFQRQTTYEAMLSAIWRSGDLAPVAQPTVSVPILRLSSRGFVSR